MQNDSGNGPRLPSGPELAQMVERLSYEEWIEFFEVVKKDFIRQAKTRRGHQQKQLANMIQFVAYGLELLKKRLKQMKTVREFSGKPSVLRGYHGTTRFVAEEIRQAIKERNPSPFIVSKNDWDWLGDGVYFWLEAPQRAADRAIWWYRILRKQRPWLPDLEDLVRYPPEGKRSHFAVIEARIRLFPKTTLNLLDTAWLEKLQDFKATFDTLAVKKLEPEKTLTQSNYNVVSEIQDVHTDQGMLRKRIKFAKEDPEGHIRTRDCKLFNGFLKKFTNIQCVVAAFREGKQIIPGVNIWDKDHVQINVIDQAVIDYSKNSIKIHDAADILDPIPGTSYSKLV